MIGVCHNVHENVKMKTCSVILSCTGLYTVCVYRNWLGKLKRNGNTQTQKHGEDLMIKIQRKSHLLMNE